jgi:Protein of unknown function (DUF4242)
LADPIAIGYPDETTADDAAAEARQLAQDLIIQLRLLAAGRTNTQIGAELFISPRRPACTSATSCASWASAGGRRPRPPPVFCLSTGPSKEAVQRVREKAGHPADEIYELPVEV